MAIDTCARGLPMSRRNWLRLQSRSNGYRHQACRPHTTRWGCCAYKACAMASIRYGYLFGKPCYSVAPTKPVQWHRYHLAPSDFLPAACCTYKARAMASIRRLHYLSSLHHVRCTYKAGAMASILDDGTVAAREGKVARTKPVQWH